MNTTNSRDRFVISLAVVLVIAGFLYAKNDTFAEDIVGEGSISAIYESQNLSSS